VKTSRSGRSCLYHRCLEGPCDLLDNRLRRDGRLAAFGAPPERRLRGRIVMRCSLIIWVLRVTSRLARGYVASDSSESSISLPLVNMVSTCCQCLSTLKALAASARRYFCLEWRPYRFLRRNFLHFCLCLCVVTLVRYPREASRFGVWGYAAIRMASGLVQRARGSWAKFLGS
jgi:hypothetical protein